MAKKNLEPDMAYDTKKLNKVFAFLSVGFFMAVVWMFLDDYVRPWKAVQIKAMKIQEKKLAQKVQEANEKLDTQKLAELKKARSSLSIKKEDLKKLDKKLGSLLRDKKNETIINGTLSASVSEVSFQYGKKRGPQKFHKMKGLKKQFADSKDRLKSLDAAIERVKNQKANLTAEFDELSSQIKSLTQARDLMKLSMNQAKRGPLFFLRNAPFVDFLDPTIKIRQIVVQGVTDDRYFQHVPKVDRCTTCHTFIDQRGHEDQPNPYKTHPNLDLMVGDQSPHPMKKWGCTACHGGEGHRVFDFNAAAHTPQDPLQQKEWEEKYHWHPPHKIPQPMLKKGMTEASCVKCHQGVEYIPGGTVINQGRRHMEKFGCYGCHKIEGWEHKRRPGPGLEKIASKITKDFFKSWVWDPKNFNQHAKMPSFFRQSNNKQEDFQQKNVTEVNAMAEWIWEQSTPYTPLVHYQKGDPEAGKELIKDIGCMGCHGVEAWPEESLKVDAFAGPYLQGLGSKLDPDWLTSWLINPSHYQEDTIMPSFRLSAKEANDLTAYLLNSRNPFFDKLQFAPLNPKLRDEILMDYLMAFDTHKAASQKLAQMTDRERTLELGRRSVRKYGCYSCHKIQGLEGLPPIGPELTYVGSKPLSQFGFNLQKDVPHSREGWIQAHLLNPRRWDDGMDKPFKDLNLMPNYNLNEQEAFEITVALLGQVSDQIPLKGRKRLNEYERAAARGLKVMGQYNCIGCHQINGHYGDILAMYDDPNDAPPRLVEEGHRVRANWLHHFLGQVSPIRPWLSVRMPSFHLSNKEKNHIIEAFMALSKVGTFEEVPENIVWAPGEREAAIHIFEDAGACISCHTQVFAPDEEPSAPNLFLARGRLRASWIKKWLKDPQAILPGTLMGNFFWDEGEALMPDILGGDVDKQIDAVTKYLLEIGKRP